MRGGIADPTRSQGTPPAAVGAQEQGFVDRWGGAAPFGKLLRSVRLGVGCLPCGIPPKLGVLSEWGGSRSFSPLCDSSGLCG